MNVTTCPCCGFKFEGDLRQGCKACGARAVGDPLPKPEHVLPGYGRTLVLVATGTLMVMSFLAEIIFTLVKEWPVSLTWSSLGLATEAAAWHLKWVFVPVAFIVLWSSGRIYKSMAKTPARFVGMRAARRGLMASVLVCLTIGTLIGVSIPKRLRFRRLGIEAGIRAHGYTIDRALLEYRALNGTLPAEQKDLLDTKRLPDPDGSIAEALANVGPTDYKPTATLAESQPKDKPRTLSGAVIASASSAREDVPNAALSFTNYELRLAGEDKILNTDDDLIVRDGVIMKASEVKDSTTLTTPVRPNKP
jgi:hypothetical protein